MNDSKVFRLAVITAGTSEPSSTRLLADRISARVREHAQARAGEVEVTVISLRELANEITAALVSQLQGPKIAEAVRVLAEADGVLVATPVYKAGVSGLFKSFFDILDNDLLIGKPVILSATAGTARHALVVDEQMRGLFAYLRTLVVPTALFAATEDWNDAALNERIDRAAVELVLLMESGFADAVRTSSWKRYQHEFGSAGGAEVSIDFDSDLMRLATGGSTNQVK
jgi:FMN reductase